MWNCDYPISSIFIGSPDTVYLVNKPLRAAGMSANNVRGEEIVPKMNIWPRIEGKYEILKEKIV